MKKNRLESGLEVLFILAEYSDFEILVVSNIDKSILSVGAIQFVLEDLEASNKLLGEKFKYKIVDSRFLELMVESNYNIYNVSQPIIPGLEVNNSYDRTDLSIRHLPNSFSFTSIPSLYFY